MCVRMYFHGIFAAKPHGRQLDWETICFELSSSFFESQERVVYELRFLLVLLQGCSSNGNK